jgi:hypothetical protein
MKLSGYYFNVVIRCKLTIILLTGREGDKPMRSTITVNGIKNDVFQTAGGNYMINVAGEGGLWIIEIEECFSTKRHNITSGQRSWHAKLWKHSKLGRREFVRYVNTKNGVMRRKTAAQMARAAILDFVAGAARACSK